MNSSDKETRPFFGPPLKASVSVEEMILGSKLVRSCHVTNNYSNSKKTNPNKHSGSAKR